MASVDGIVQGGLLVFDGKMSDDWKTIMKAILVSKK